MLEPNVQWVTAAPLWATTVSDITAFNRPVIVRFATDTFMNDLLALLDSNPARLSDLVVRYENWREPMRLPAPIEPVTPTARSLARVRPALAPPKPAAVVGANPTAPPRPLKLYQAAHLRHYLVTACLVCQVAGLPDRILDSAAQERVSMIVRRRRPNPDRTKPQDEYAFVINDHKPVWKRVSNINTLVPGEEQTTLFPITFTAEDGRRRRLLAGLVPVAKRETYLGALVLADSGDPAPAPATEPPLPTDPRVALFQSQVTGPWQTLIEQAAAVKKLLVESDAVPLADRPPDYDYQKSLVLKAAREQIQTVSWYVLLDFYKYLKDYLPDVRNAIDTVLVTTPAPAGDNGNLLNALKVGPSAALVNALITGEFNSANNRAISAYTASDVLGSIYEALAAIAKDGREDQLEKIVITYDRKTPKPADRQPSDPAWPSFLFPLADPLMAAPLPTGELINLERLVAQALRHQALGAVPPLPLAAQPVVEGGEGEFIIRFVFERPACAPRLPGLPALPAGALLGLSIATPPDAVLISLPTTAFKMAPFFDPDAPARPIRITLPVDTTPAGLRKFDKNTAFMISESLCKQLDGLGDVTLGDLVLSVLPWPFHKNLNLSGSGSSDCDPDGGKVCTFSIPIITICAMIIMLIFVKLFDLIFNWWPLFKVCFPLPGFKSKEQE